MSQIITLAVDVQADTARLFEILTTTEGQRAFWTADCDVAADRAARAACYLARKVITQVGARLHHGTRHAWDECLAGRA